MGKTYFSETIDKKELLVTESYVRYDSDVIPINAVSFFGFKQYNWKVVLIIGLVLLVFGVGFLVGRAFFGPGTLSFLCIYFISVGFILSLVALFLSLYRMVVISSHSKHSIQIDMFGFKEKKTYEPLIKALYEAVEDNNPINIANRQNEE